jgi:hypothetical protein
MTQLVAVQNYIEQGSWQETIPFNDSRSEMASGLINQRRRFSKQYISIAVHLLLTEAEWVHFQFHLKLVGHAYNDWLDPRDGSTVSCRIASPIKVDYIKLDKGGYHRKVAFTMERLA